MQLTSSKIGSAAPAQLTSTQRISQKNGHRKPLVTYATGNTFGNMFRVTTFGESHGGGVGCIVDGVPPRLKITLVSTLEAMDRSCAVGTG